MADKNGKAAPRYLGLWIDHHVARIVEVDARSSGGSDAAGAEELGDDGGDVHRRSALVETIESGVSRKPSQGNTAHQTFRGGWQVSAPSRERIIERAFRDRLTRFYKTVAARLQGAARVWVMGPGQAKTEFLRVLESCSAGATSMAQDAAAAMAKVSDRQLVAMVRAHFHPQEMAYVPAVARRRNRRLNLSLNHQSYGAERGGRRRR
jgi:hypothetical protein